MWRPGCAVISRAQISLNFAFIYKQKLIYDLILLSIRFNLELRDWVWPCSAIACFKYICLFNIYYWWQIWIFLRLNTNFLSSNFMEYLQDNFKELLIDQLHNLYYIYITFIFTFIIGGKYESFTDWIINFYKAISWKISKIILKSF